MRAWVLKNYSSIALMWIAYFAGYAKGSGESGGWMGYLFMGGCVVLIALRYWATRHMVPAPA